MRYERGLDIDNANARSRFVFKCALFSSRNDALRIVIPTNSELEIGMRFDVDT